MQYKPRAQAPETREYEALQPPPLPGSTYVRPVQEGPAGNNALRLASALGDLNPSLARFGTTLMEDERKRELENVQAQEPLKSDKEAQRDYLARGGPPADFDAAGIAQSKLYGARRAQQLQNDIITDLGGRDVDWRTFDPSSYLAERQKEYTDQFKDDRHALIGFNERLSGFPAKLIEMRTQGALAKQQAMSKDNTFEAISLSADAAAGQPDATPESVGRAVRSAIQQVAGPNGSQGVPYADADKMVIQKARQWVSEGKHLDAAVGLLTGAREDEKGLPLPALVNSAANQEQVRSVIQAATTAKAKLAKQQALEAVTAADTEALNSGASKLATVGDITYQGDDGITKVITASKRQDDAVRRFNDVVSPGIAKANRENPLQTFDRELTAYTQAGIVNPKWTAALNAAPQTASLSDLSQPAKRDAFLAAAHLYDQLREKNPFYLQQSVEGSTRDFFDAYRVAKGMRSPAGGDQLMTMEEAADMARRALISDKDDESVKGKVKEIKSAVDDVDPRSFFAKWLPNWAGGESGPVNKGYLAQQIKAKAEIYARVGQTADDAIKNAGADVAASSTIVNGWVLPKLKSSVPGGFAPAATDYLKSFWEQNARFNAGVDGKGIGLVDEGAGTFTIVAPNGIALRTPNGLARFTLKDLGSFYENKDAHLREKLLTEGAAKRSSSIDASKVKDVGIKDMLDAYNSAGGWGSVLDFPAAPKPGGAQKSSFWDAINPMGKAHAASFTPQLPREAQQVVTGQPPSSQVTPAPDAEDMPDISSKATYARGNLGPVKGFVFHHTGGRGDPDGVVNTLNQRGLGVQFVMDRDGKIYRTLPNGARGAHMRPSEINDLSNANTVGMEVIANDDSDITPAQVKASKVFFEKLKKENPDLQAFGHGELNTHKQSTEGSTIVKAIREAGLADAPKKDEDKKPVPLSIQKRTLGAMIKAQKE